MATEAPSESRSRFFWYQDAVIYQLHVRSFFDSDEDGIGDFRGLTEKLDYIQALGVNAIWLLPFFPSPLRDGGYDISDYASIHAAYGTQRDFTAFLREAHQRDIRVITELVLNHTSDQHRWFQRSRRAKPGTRWRDYYVWSDTADRYPEARIIFEDFEASNWTWDPVAGQYFWHRFYHHQPDLNYDNPEVRETMMKVVDHWFELGVDGLRLDAVPYLFQREGTSCENLPETHAYLRELRAHIDAHFQDKMLLAEANQWPDDAAAYFGNGDECHMNFHFPLMPRLFMAVEREDRFPIIDILEQTPQLAAGCQWAIFLRNHDELTLEMVTDEERDYMYRAYAGDPQARLNLGIRRRLAPLLKNNRREIELMHGLLLSLPGTPIIYYGDEIGMGDNIYLGDRDGVRTPMQWSADRNAGFSRANPQQLFLPVNIDSENHYSARNVEIEEKNPNSLLWWMRRIIHLRLRHKAFGRGTFEHLWTENGKVFAFLRRYGEETLLVVANLSRFTQCAELDLSEFRGQTPVELFGQTRFPPIGELPYFLTLGPHAFHWFRLQWRKSESVKLSPTALPSCRVVGDWDEIFAGQGRSKLVDALELYLRRHAWFTGGGRVTDVIELLDVFAMDGKRLASRESGNGQKARHAEEGSAIRLVMIRVEFTEGDPEIYAVPMVLADEARAANILGDHPNAGILKVTYRGGREQGTLCEASFERELWLSLLEQIARRRTVQGTHSKLTGMQTKAFRRLCPAAGLPEPNILTSPQSNSSAVFGKRLILKLFRRIESGTNPEFEIGNLLTERVPLAYVPDVGGAIDYQPVREAAMTVAVLHEYRANEADAWRYTLDELGRFLERIQAAPQGATAVLESSTLLDRVERQTPALAEEMIGSYLQAACLLGKRTAELHIALASCADAGFEPEPFSKRYQRGLYQAIRTTVSKSLTLLRRGVTRLQDDTQAMARRLLELEPQIMSDLRQIRDREIPARRVRCHGDYRLGQVLFTGKDFVVIDFEGEPERSLVERRIKQSPLRDVAGMIESFHAATRTALHKLPPGLMLHPVAMASPEAWLQFWCDWTAASFLRSYLAEAAGGDFLPPGREDIHSLLQVYRLEKACDELYRELRRQSERVTIPLHSLLELLQ